MSSRFRSFISLLLVACLLLTGPAAPLMARDKASGTVGSVPHVAGQVGAKAGGWGLLTPLIVFGARAVEAGYEDGEFHLDEATEFMGSATFWKGFAGDALLSWVFGTVSAMLPGGPVIRNFVAITGGFVGWELGTGNLARTDWTNLFGQVLAATAVQTGLGLVGFASGGFLVSMAAAAAAIATGILIDHLRDDADEELDEADAPRAPPATVGPAAAGTSAGIADPGAARARVEERYRALVEGLRDGDADEARRAYELYREDGTVRPDLTEMLEAR